MYGNLSRKRPARFAPLNTFQRAATTEISVIVRTDNEAIFVKGRKADHPQAWTQDRERIINPYVRHIYHD